MCAEDVRPARLSDAPVPEYTLPDPLRCDDGTLVTTAAAWESKRRSELLELFAREVYGRTPLGRPEGQHAETTSIDPAALGGLATRKEITIWFARDRSGPVMRVLLYVPNSQPRKPRPLFLGLNFYGNHTVSADPGITLAGGWIPKSPGVVENRATEAARGTAASRWQIEAVLARGYATATVYSGDLCPDRSDGLAEGVNGWFARTATESRADDAWGAIGVWAWGLSRALDVLAADPDIDAARVAVHGHSRMGKAALWAGAQDTRFALVISNESGCGGAALSKRIHGETVARINTSFPHWFAKNFRRYNDAEAELPVDQHQLLALIAPRALHVASAEDDDWADPHGEFLSVRGAEPVFALFGQKGPGLADVPPVHSPAGETLRYHIRSGPHDMTAYDWSAYLDTADRVLCWP
ncbi:MAG: acetylxylan esterase [Opitutaceae bacterium]|nr:acetylxylan esterase [Opitutaceae bacterium]